MEKRYEVRLDLMLAHAEVTPELMQGLLGRLESFVEPLDSLHNSSRCARTP